MLMRNAIGVLSAFVLASALQASVSYPPPTTWKAINYSPPQHSLDKMLYDWDSTIKTQVDADLSTLSSNGFNVIHLYLWDRSSRLFYNSSWLPGFCSSASDNSACSGHGTDPKYSPGVHDTQWNNLDAFLTEAENYGIWVMLEFANYQVTEAIAANAGTCSTYSSDYGSWMNEFVDYFVTHQGHNNIIAWGLNFAWVPNNPSNCTNESWAESYGLLKNHLVSVYGTARPLQAKVGVALGLDVVNPVNHTGATDILPRGTGYTYDWGVLTSPWNIQGAQQIAKAMYDNIGTYTSLGSQDPDFYMPGGYNANTRDLYSALDNLISTSSSGGRQIPASKIFFNEFGASSSLTETSPTWYAYGSYGDKQLPVFSQANQGQWITNTLCAFSAISSLPSGPLLGEAYWNMYDPETWWSDWNPGTVYPYNLSPSALAYQQYFGLKTQSGTTKTAAWNALTSYYQGTLSCPSGTGNNAPPLLELHTDTTYLTVNQPVGVYWTASDVDAPSGGNSLTLNTGYTGGSRSCAIAAPPATAPGAVISSSTLDGSCAYTVGNAYTTTGSKNITMTAYNGSTSSPAPVSETAVVTVYTAPQIASITDSAYHQDPPAYFTPTSNFIVWGYTTGGGYSAQGGNVVHLHNNSTAADYWLSEGNGLVTWDLGYFQINANLGGVPSGPYTVTVLSPYSSTESNGYSLTIH